MSEFERDEDKRQANLVKHRLDFGDVPRLFDGGVSVRRSPYQPEERFLATGMLDGDWVTPVFTWRDGRKRVISIRPASRDERGGHRPIYR